jgi:hypothetical protein
LRDYQPDNDIVLVGDCIIMRGETFIIAGEPGVGKVSPELNSPCRERRRRDWFWTHSASAVSDDDVQTENGRYRLRLEFSSLDCDEIENWIQ